MEVLLTLRLQPNATLAAVIIHAVGDLITPPNTVYQFWLVSPLEVFIFFVGVIVTVFSTIEIGIYCTISISAAILVFRIIKAKGRFLGRVQVHSIIGDHLLNDQNAGDKREQFDNYGTFSNSQLARNVFLPINNEDGSNPELDVKSPCPGIFIYRFSEGFNYPNANHYLDHLTNYIFANTNRTNPHSYPRPGDRPWNDPGPRRGKTVVINPNLPKLKAIILDFSSVNNVDITSIQQLIDVRNQLDRYASPDRVEWHLACIHNRWTKRALLHAGFGYPKPSPLSKDSNEVDISHYTPIFSVAGIGGRSSAEQYAEDEEKAQRSKLRAVIKHDGSRPDSIGNVLATDGDAAGESSRSNSEEIARLKAGGVAARVKLVHGMNLPLFHTDLTNALESAIANVQALEALEAKGGKDISQEEV